MKLFKLTNLKTGKVVKNNATQADIDALQRWVPDKASPQVTGLSLYMVEEFDIPERGGATFKPPAFPRMPVPKEETKGLPAGGQNIDGSESN